MHFEGIYGLKTELNYPFKQLEKVTSLFDLIWYCFFSSSDFNC